MMNIFEQATIYAFKCHNGSNHSYDGLPYTFHLDMADEVALQFIYLIPEKDQLTVRAGIRCHDIMEMCDQVYSQVAKNTNIQVADIAYALTPDKGKNRAQRMGPDYYRLVIITQHATYAKLCDRIANIKHSKRKNSPRFKMYKNEHAEFCENMLRHKQPKYEVMFQYMDQLFSEN